MPRLVLIRGLPGSGKSTYAQKFVEQGFFHLEADMWFVIDGTYEFRPSELLDAHEWCQNRTVKYLSEGRDVVVSNTFTQFWEMSFYFNLAKTYKDLKIHVIEMPGAPFKNIHNVPDLSINKMIRRWEEYSVQPQED